MRAALVVLCACGSGGTGPGHATTPSTPIPSTVTHPTTGPITVSGVGFRLHEQYGSLVYLEWTETGTGAIHVEFSFDEGEWLSSPTVTRGDGAQSQLLLGIPYDADVSWRIVAASGVLAEGADVRTGPVPPKLPLASLEVARDDLWYADGRFLLTSVDQTTGGWTEGPFWTVILDRKARPVWARLTPRGAWTLFAQVSTASPDHLLLDEDTVWSDFDDGAGSQVVRTYLDAPIDTVRTQGLQHAFVEQPDGTLAWGSAYHDDVEALMELAPGDADPTEIWSCRDWPGAGDCESNGMFYDAVTDAYLYSFWTNDAVVDVAAGSGTTRWWAGAVPGGFAFVPRDSQFELQHGVSFTDARTLLLSSEEAGPYGFTTMAREFAVDETAKTLSLVWSFDAGVHAVTDGDAWRLPNGNTLHVVGSAGVVDEVTPDGTVAWDIDWHSERLVGHGTVLTDLYALASPP